jgi:hypothetical protein
MCWELYQAVALNQPTHLAVPKYGLQQAMWTIVSRPFALNSAVAAADKSANEELFQAEPLCGLAPSMKTTIRRSICRL